MAGLYVGTSGWSYDHWGGRFYPAGLPAAPRLDFYASRFSTVEVNFSFYRLPSQKAIAGWRHRAPPGFLYAVKGSRLITHALRLRDCREALRVFLERVQPLTPHLGPILWQLPPNLEKDVSLLADFLLAAREVWEGLIWPPPESPPPLPPWLPQKPPEGPPELPETVEPPPLRQAFEFRHESWFGADVRKSLEGADAALVVASHAGAAGPPAPTADFVYCRFHGLSGFAHDYSAADLGPWARYIRRALHAGRDTFAYFNNDGEAKAPKNAAELAALVSSTGSRSSKSPPPGPGDAPF